MANQYQSSPLLLVLSSLLLLLPDTYHSQTSFISVSCSERNASDLAASAANIAAVLSDMRRNISSSASDFAASQRNRGPEPVYAVFQCREYLSPADCLACYEAAAARVRRDCPDADGSTAYYEGCFLRYENDNVYDDYTILGRAGRCDDREVAAVEEGAVSSTALGLMLELVEAVPAIRRYYAAVRRPVGGGGAAAMIYGVAQCVLTLSSGDCRSCLRLAYENIQGCLPAAEATAVDVGCFMRYADQAFFNESQVVDLDRFIRTGGEHISHISCASFSYSSSAHYPKRIES